ncbi:MAG: prepilin-type N-terminal cleavage/methylation domain-containing protein [Coriobacteriales bacterium]|nr:prepilin-type N-terminal cleavage/methylation domain-containing protein [Coriobacteriales bacterium]
MPSDTFRASDQRRSGNNGFTLVEVVVAIAILAIVMTVVVGSFVTAANISARTKISSTDAESVEDKITKGEGGEATPLDDFELNGFKLPSESVTYTEGGRSYTVLVGTDPVSVNVPTLYMGDFTAFSTLILKLDPTDEYITEGLYDSASKNVTDDATKITMGTAMPPDLSSVTTSFVGVKTSGSDTGFEYKAPASGYYRLEVWGAGANGPNYGGYSYGVIQLAQDDKLYLYVGGASPGTSGGANGGGTASSSGGKGGGGATDIRMKAKTVSLSAPISEKSGDPSLYTRVIVAGGAGAGSASSEYGPGGGTSGGTNGGTQTSGANFGFGGAGSSAGGGGWYGGKAGIYGSGGSGWVFTVGTYNVWKASAGGSKETELTETNYTFADMAADGYYLQPDPEKENRNPTTVKGSSKTSKGGGFIRITYLGTTF